MSDVNPINKRAKLLEKLHKFAERRQKRTGKEKFKQKVRKPRKKGLKRTSKNKPYECMICTKPTASRLCRKCKLGIGIFSTIDKLDLAKRYLNSRGIPDEIDFSS